MDDIAIATEREAAAYEQGKRDAARRTVDPADPRVTAARDFVNGPFPRFDRVLPATTVTRWYHQLRRATIGLLELIDGDAEPSYGELKALAAGKPDGSERPEIVCLCGSTRFYDEFQQANYDLTMLGAIVLSVGFYPHAKAEHGHGEGVGHDSAEKVALDELHKRKIDLADWVLVVSDRSGYFGESTRSEIAYAVERGKPVRFQWHDMAQRAFEAGLIPALDTRMPGKITRPGLDAVFGR